MDDRACLVVLPSGAEPASERVLEAARASGLDPVRLRIQLNGRSLAAVGRGSTEQVSAAAQALSGAGLASAVVTEAQARALPHVQVAGGVAPDEGGGVTLRVHGQPAGPPSGVPLLFVVADVGRDDPARGAAEARPGDSMRQRLLRAVFPVVDLVWADGRLRVPVKSMTWRGLPGAGLSGPGNLLRLLELLAERSAGAVVDVGFMGQDLAINPFAGTEPLEGADKDRVAFFDRYAAAAAIAWSRGLYPAPSPGEVVEVGAAGSPSAGLALARSVKAQAFFARPGASGAGSPVPWVRQGRAARLRQRLWPWLVLGPALFFVLPQRLSAIALAFAGCGAIVFGLRSLSLREKLRSVPVSKVRSMAMGLVQISGKTAATALLKAPYSHLECVWYCFDVKAREQSSERGIGWRTIAEGSSSNMPFLVEDATGSVLVQPADAEIDVDPGTISLDEDTLVREWILPAGTPVFVNGFARRRSTDVSEARGGAPPLSDDVFIGSDPGVSFTIATQSRGQEQTRLEREFVLGVASGGVYLVTALILWVALAP